MTFLVFYAGVVVGTFIGVGLMCLLALGKDPAEQREMAAKPQSR
jgi:hypothetical protein